VGTGKTRFDAKALGTIFTTSRPRRTSPISTDHPPSDVERQGPQPAVFDRRGGTSELCIGNLGRTAGAVHRFVGSDSLPLHQMETTMNPATQSPTSLSLVSLMFREWPQAAVFALRESKVEDLNRKA